MSLFFPFYLFYNAELTPAYVIFPPVQSEIASLIYIRNGGHIMFVPALVTLPCADTGLTPAYAVAFAETSINIVLKMLSFNLNCLLNSAILSAGIDKTVVAKNPSLKFWIS